ncbi:hypothetical protein [Streptomyces melanogenes]|uniref:hypothetical protein n=1 Tax=Streptomyces melanogenes TaxID=67326 RepID=UPI00167DA769|nr:hypothetical protein [Streptomyces melanogenes]
MRFERRIFVSAGVLLAAASLAACGGGQREKSTTADYVNVLGSWVSKSGGEISFKKNGTFEAKSLMIDSQLFTACPSGATTGTWGFFKSDGDMDYVSADAKSGKTIGLTFDKVPQGQCGVRVNFVKDGSVFCLSDDPEVLCSTKERFTKR